VVVAEVEALPKTSTAAASKTVANI
jgi:hypothetical protein